MLGGLIDGLVCAGGRILAIWAYFNGDFTLENAKKLVMRRVRDE